ncbi:MAG: response regulator [Deltaproteobacteria bacterium]|nr:response regulator [Deltaproteobacteria bacterium]
MGVSVSAPALLVVDDNQGFVDLTSALIRHAYPDARVGTAATGAEALHHLIGSPWDVVLLDYRLPDIDGVEVLAEVRNRGIDVAVVMVTGEGDQELAADLFRMGAYDYLVKGRIRGITLRRTIDQALTRRRLEEHIREQSDELTQTSLALEERARALDTAYAKLRERKEQLLTLSESLEQTVLQRTGELRETTRFLNKVLASATDHFIIATGAEGTILTFNEGAVAAFGRPPEDVVGRAHFRLLFDEIAEDDDALAALVAEIVEGGSIQRTLTGVAGGSRPFVAKVTLSQLRGDQKDGEETDRAETSSPPTTHHKAGIVIVGSDVTNERQLEEKNRVYIRQIEVANADLIRKNEQILEATRLKSEFIANVSHELRTPLNAIIGYADLLDGGIYGEINDRQGNAVQGISSRAQDLLRLINGILDLAKIESGRTEIHPEEFLLDAVVLELVETARILAADKKLSVEWEDRSAAGAALYTDRNRLRQILLNLVNNAVKFTSSGFVTVDCTLPDEGVLSVRVTDTGIGIPEKETESIFDEFRQVDGTSTRRYEGSGLGLAISRKFATNLGGTLTCRSTLGEGSTFELRIPVRLEAVPKAPLLTGHVDVGLSTLE